jgi:hypothetical protein
MIRLLLEDLTLFRSEQITVTYPLQRRRHQNSDLPLPLRSWQEWETSRDMIDRLLGQHTHQQIAAILNQRPMHSGKGKPFTSAIVAGI